MPRLFSALLITILAPVIAHAADPADATTPTDNSWHANAATVAAASKRAGFNFEESKVGDYKLPDPLIAADGTPVTVETWPARRAEILALFESQVFGHAPAGA